MDSRNTMDKDEIIELEAEEVPEAERELEGILGITQTIDITPKPNYTWEDVAELWDQNEIKEDE